jgi:hypothetical protein
MTGGHGVWHILVVEAWASRSQHCSAVSGPGGGREKAGHWHSQDGDHPSRCVYKQSVAEIRTTPCGSGSGRKGGTAEEGSGGGGGTEDGQGHGAI